jgi:hypothetical protein
VGVWGGPEGAVSGPHAREVGRGERAVDLQQPVQPTIRTLRVPVEGGATVIELHAKGLKALAGGTQEQ